MDNITFFSIKNIFQPFESDSDIEQVLKTRYDINVGELVDNLNNDLLKCSSYRDKVTAVYHASLKIANPLNDAQKWLNLLETPDNLNYFLDLFLATDALFLLRASKSTEKYEKLEDFYTAKSGKPVRDENEDAVETETVPKYKGDDKGKENAKNAVGKNSDGSLESNFRNFSKHAANRLRNTPLNYLWDIQQNAYRNSVHKITDASKYEIPKFMDNYLYSLLCVKATHPFAESNNGRLTFYKITSFFERFYAETNLTLTSSSLENSKQLILSNYLTRQLFDINTAAYISQIFKALSSNNILRLHIDKDYLLDFLIPLFFIPNPFARNCYCNLIFRLLLDGNALITRFDNQEALKANIIASIKSSSGPAALQEDKLQKIIQFLQHQIFSVYPLLRSVFYYLLCEAFTDEDPENALLSFIRTGTIGSNMFIADKYDLQKSKAALCIESLIVETSKAFPQLPEPPKTSWADFGEALKRNSNLLVSVFNKLNAKLNKPGFIESLYRSSQLNYIDSTTQYRTEILEAVVTAKAKTDIGLFPHYDA